MLSSFRASACASGLLALRIRQKVFLHRRHAAIDPGLAHRIEDGDLGDAVVAALVVAADERPTAVRERDVAGAEDVVVQPLRVPGIRDRGFGKSDIRFGDQRLAVVVEDAELASVFEGVGMRQVPADEVVALDGAIGDALIQAVWPSAEAEAAINKAFEFLLQTALLVHQVVAGVLCRPHAEADLRPGLLGPRQAGVDRVFRQGDQRAELPDCGGIRLLGRGLFRRSVRSSSWPPTAAPNVQWISSSLRPPWLISTLVFGCFRSIIALLYPTIDSEFTP